MNSRHHRNSWKATCGCPVDRALHHDDNYIFITDAQRQSSGGKTYTAYHIRIGDIELKRRYSEFESLRNVLIRLYPAVIVPPIPEKHSFVDYAALRSKDDKALVEKRKRMLQTFLNRLAKHPELGKDHHFHQFLESNVLWSDIVRTPPLSLLPRNPLQMVISKTSPASHATLTSPLIPSPATTYVLKTPDPRFTAAENLKFHISNYLSNHLDKSQRKIMRRLEELANDEAESGAMYNALSLYETGRVANAVERIGQAVDASSNEITQMVASLEGEFAEPIQEQAQFAHIIKEVLRFRHLKHAQVEMIEMSLNCKKETLDSLLRIENETKQLEEAVSAVDPDDMDQTVMLARQHPARWGGPVNLFSMVGHTLQNIVDVDPAATRRNQISKSKDAVGVLQEALHLTRKDLAEISVGLQADLDRSQREKIRDLRDMLIAYAKTHIRYCQKNLDSWQECQDEVNKIPI
ncbi:Sorting nexin, cytoplasm-to-vacuole targeting pathway/endosomal sorting [Apophysomyces sp. BC1034]|nr:Sorting nexin, cytoplasm-to-vacuole targeting pathway/endosomal sorting [Apophysomyces sp. BC1015]KAG0178469.1 Sorting nexin, cytoplasm-to-vacuole targeting pathway/endosomal sorting [Apophysomyces sp. BC1021]KAG0186046.1 Sorting nexin, cytoplasm-to-vacuole targeting pathway/endosomal sorting [Apophysomyces sp. BC1034]